MFHLVSFSVRSASAEIFSELQRSKVIQAEPAVLHYGGYEVGKHHQQTLVSFRAGILLGLMKGQQKLSELLVVMKHFALQSALKSSTCNQWPCGNKRDECHAVCITGLCGLFYLSSSRDLHIVNGGFKPQLCEREFSKCTWTATVLASMFTGGKILKVSLAFCQDLRKEAQCIDLITFPCEYLSNYFSSL